MTNQRQFFSTRRALLAFALGILLTAGVASAGDPYMPGDLNGDAVRNTADLYQMMGYVDGSISQPSYHSNRWYAADINLDDQIDDMDLLAIYGMLLFPTPPTATGAVYPNVTKYFVTELNNDLKQLKFALGSQDAAYLDLKASILAFKHAQPANGIISLGAAADLLRQSTQTKPELFFLWKKLAGIYNVLSLYNDNYHSVDETQIIWQSIMGLFSTRANASVTGLWASVGPIQMKINKNAIFPILYSFCDFMLADSWLNGCYNTKLGNDFWATLMWPSAGYYAINLLY
jgi:hypothetical protein